MRSIRLALTTALLASLAATCFQLDGPLPALAGSQSDIVGPTGSHEFGANAIVLANGNFVIGDYRYDSASATDVGAVYLYDGNTHQLISMVTGSTAGDQIGLGRIYEVGDSNIVVLSPHWTNPAGPIVHAGAITWIDGNSGLDGAVSVANSLVGATANDDVGIRFTLLSNGNYVTGNVFWHAGGSEVGAATWGDGNAPAIGVVGPANSLVGVTSGDQVGDQITPLANGNYVVTPSFWDDIVNGHPDAGAAVWGNGSTAGPRRVGPVTTGNSLWGPHSQDHLGYEVLALTNGNYVVISPSWDLDAVNTNVGAATLGNGTSGTVGFVGASNSLHGTVAGEALGTNNIGNRGSVALANGNYVVATPRWTNGGTTVDGGAVTWRSGANSALGQGEAISTSNSLYGTTAGDQVGVDRVVALTNGNYVVGSPNWDGPSAANAGAATWAAGSGPVNGPISATNSLVGTSPGDHVGGDVVALSNGNYVAGSADWNGRRGAVTFGDGNGGPVGVIDATNSLVGSVVNDQVGTALEPLPNGNYVVGSRAHNGGRGAATWADGTTGLVGELTDVNSLVGDTANDHVGDRITVLTNGNYVASSEFWNRGAIVDAGAATLGDGTVGTSGHVSALNSLVGAAAGDNVSGAVALPGGSYMVRSGRDNGPIADAGSATFGPPTGVRGEITTANSVIGTVAMGYVAPLPGYTTDGSVLVLRPENVVTLYHPNLTPPVLPTPADIHVTTAPGATTAAVDYPLPVAIEDEGPAPVVCAPPPGTVFPLGTTTVTCTATNDDSVTTTVTFHVIVTEGGDYLPLAPARLADTRPGHTTIDGLFAAGGPLAAGATLELPLAGRGGVPANAVAAALNVTVTEAGADGFLTVFPCGSPRPTASNLNYGVGTTVPNAVITKLGPNGRVCLFAQQSVHLVVDVNGAFPPETTYMSINPARVLDTRADHPTIDGGNQGTGAAAAGSITTLPVTGRAGVPADAIAVVLNVTVTEAGAAGYATVFPCGSTPPTASNLNYVQGTTIPNLVVAKIGNGGAVCVFTQSTVHLVADVLGYLPTGTTYSPLLPARLLDTRGGFPTIDGVLAGAGVRPLGTVTVVHVAGRGGVPADATTAVLNVTVTEPAADGYATVYPCGIDPPLASNLNFTTGQTIPNAVLARIGTDGNVCIFNSQPTHLVADVMGYFP